MKVRFVIVVAAVVTARFACMTLGVAWRVLHACRNPCEGTRGIGEESLHRPDATDRLVHGLLVILMKRDSNCQGLGSREEAVVTALT